MDNDLQHAAEVDQRNEAKAYILAHLLGLRRMAEVEAAYGSQAWAGVPEMIDVAITKLGEWK